MPLMRPAGREGCGSRWLELSTILLLLECRPGDRILDIGACSYGESKLIRRCGYNAVMVDCGPAAARRRYVSRFAGAAADEQVVRWRGRLPFDDQSFDGALGMQVLHRATNLPRILTELCRVLKPGARAVFCESNHGAARLRPSSGGRAPDQPLGVLEIMRAAVASGFADAMLSASFESPLTLIPLVEAERQRGGCRRRSSCRPTTDAAEPCGCWSCAVLVRGGERPRTTRRPRLLRGRITVYELPPTVVAGQTITVRAMAENVGDTVWLREPSRFGGFVTIGCRVLAPSGRLLAAGLGRTNIPADVAPGDRIRATLRVKVPRRLAPGSYVLSVDLVNELVCYFSDLDARGASRHKIEVLAART